jgi:hypothetical protein
VVNSKGEVIAVALTGFNGSQNLNLAIPSRYLSAMIKTIKPMVPHPIAHQEISLLDKVGAPSAEGVQGGYLPCRRSAESGAGFPRIPADGYGNAR